LKHDWTNVSFAKSTAS